MKKAIYPGTFDPVTLGHIDIIKRSTKLCDELIVAVAYHTAKTTVFDINERIEMIEAAIKDLKNVKVVEFKGMLVDFVHAQNANIIIRGLRTFSDYEYELQLALANRRMAPDIETVFIMSSVENTFVSATLLKQIASIGGDLNSFVPECVANKLKGKLKHRIDGPLAEGLK